MFSKEIVQSSRFLRLPPTCRLLYYDLGMSADDDGYCEWYPVIQMTGAKEADLEILARAHMIHVFDGEVLIINDWKINNLIRSDRYQKSKHLGKYGLTEPLKLGIPHDNQVQPQVRLGKDSKYIAPAEPSRFVWSEYLKTMDDNPRKHVQLIAYFFRERSLKFDSQEEVSEAIARHSPAARRVLKFPEAKVTAAFGKAKSKYRDVDWTLETILKVLTN